MKSLQIGALAVVLLGIGGSAAVGWWQAEPSGEQPRTERGATEIEGLRRDAERLRAQVDRLIARIDALNNDKVDQRAAWLDDTAVRRGEFLAVHRTGGRRFGGDAALARFNAEGPLVDTLRSIDNEVHHVTADPASGRLYGIGSHRVVTIDPRTLKITELPLGSGVPELSWPCGIAFDTQRNRVVVASLGGSGYLYGFDPVAHQWSLIADLQNLDLAGLAYSPEKDAFYGLEVSHQGDVLLHKFTPNGARVGSMTVRVDVAPTPFGQLSSQLAMSGERIVAIATREDHGDGFVAAQPQRLFVIEPKFDGERGASSAKTGANRQFRPIQLDQQANQLLDAPFHLEHMRDNNLAELPRGEQALDGVMFLIGKRCLQLGGPMLASKPKQLSDINVTGLARKLHFLHATGWGEGQAGESDPGFVPDGTIVGHYGIRYADGSIAESPIVYGSDLRGWWKFHDMPETNRATVAWTGANPMAKAMGAELRLYHTIWENPRPDAPIESISFSAEGDTLAAPFCVAITAEGEAPAE